MADVLLKPAFFSPYLDGPDATKLQPSAWNAARLFSGGVDGEIVVRDAASATGAAWLSPATLLADLVLTGDVRLSDARVPLAHTHLFADLTVTKADLGLGAVENTALSTWGGSATLATVGPVTLTPTTLKAGEPTVGLVAHIGEGRACGNPIAAPSAVADGAGVLTGTYQYAFYEADPTGPGTTGLSPLSAPIVLAGQKTLVTVPLPRRGMGGRYLCRTKAGGSVFYFVKGLNGHSFVQTIWPDNATDASLTQLAPTVDTTILYSFEAGHQVKFFRTHPDQGALPADVGVLTGDPLAGTYSIDCYGTAYFRGGPTSRPLQTQMVGTADVQYAAYYLPLQNDGSGTANPGTIVFLIKATGETSIRPPLPLGAAAALDLYATMPAAAGILNAIEVVAVGNGSTAVTQAAQSLTFSPGYSGTGVTYGLRAINLSGHVGGSIGVQGDAGNTAATNVGLQGRAYGGTNNIAVFGGLGSTITGVGAGTSGVFVANNGATALSLFLGLNNGSLVYQMLATGAVLQRISAIAVTSTDGLTFENATAASAGVPVQMAARIRFRSRVWNTSASVVDDWKLESKPVSAATPTGLFTLGYALNGAAYVNALTVTSAGAVVALASVDAPAYKVGGAAGVSGTFSSVTVVNGLVTAGTP
jgi:hypothetical protein